MPREAPVEKPPQNVGYFPGLSNSPLTGAELNKSEPEAEFYGRAGTEEAAAAAAAAGGAGRDPPPFLFILPSAARFALRPAGLWPEEQAAPATAAPVSSFRISLGLSRASDVTY